MRTSDIGCYTCSDLTCDTIVEDSTRNRLQWESAILSTANVAVSSDSNVNGAEDVTFRYDMILGNKITADGIVTLVIPKQNYYFVGDLGASVRECMLMDCDESLLEVSVKTALSSIAVVETDVEVDFVDFLFEEADELHDWFTIWLKNTDPIEAGLQLRVYLYPFKNPSINKPLVTFAGWT